MKIEDKALMKVAVAIGEEEAIRIIEFMQDCKKTTDDELANKTEIKLNTVRKILYRLYDHSLVSLKRTRDPATGWFIFHWKLQPNQLEGFIISQKRRVFEKLDIRLEYEKNHDFYCCCAPGCRLVPFEEAVELLFRCPECGKSLAHYDNQKIIEKLTEKVENLRKELSE